MSQITRRVALAALAVLAFTVLAGPAVAADKVKLLIIDGQSGHDWKATTPAIKDLLEKTGRFTVDVLTSPAALPRNPDDAAKKANEEAWAKFKPDFAAYAVVLINYTGQPWPAAVRQDFEKYVSNGGGLVAYHFSVASFQDWPAYNQMIGQGWRPSAFGDSLVLDEAGKEVRRAPNDGPGGSHGPAHPFEVTIRDPEHPICKGLPAKLAHAKDELYHAQRGPAQNMHVLTTAFDDKAFGGTGLNELMCWTVSFGKGRVFVTLLGHDVPATVDPTSATLLTRGAEWAGTGAVTLAAPAEVGAGK